MSVLYKISGRNLLRHKGKSIVIGMILFFGAVIMTLGNATINGMNKGMQKSFVKNFFGDVILMATNHPEDDIISGMPKAMPVIENYSNVKNALDKIDYIDSYYSATRGMAMLLNPDGDMGYAFFMGIDYPKYQEMFNSNIVTIEGKGLEKGERGVLINFDAREQIYQQQNYWIVPAGYDVVASNLSPEVLSNKDTVAYKSNLIAMGASLEGTEADIRIKVNGVFKFRTMNALLKNVNFMDIDSYRELYNYIGVQDADVEVSKATEKILSSDTEDMDAMFSDEAIGVETGNNTTEISKADVEREDEGVINKDVKDSGSYNFVSVKLKEGMGLEESTKALNEEFKKQGLSVRAVTWKKASGMVAQMGDIIGMALNIFVFFLYFVAAIVIMNTLSMSAMERVSEIGMMRAVGTQKSFISKMFILETGILAVVFGVGGMLFAGLVSAILSGANITTTNDMVQLMFGGDIFRPSLDIRTIIFCLIQLVLVTFVSIIYPIRVARKITPLDAISRD